LHPETVVSRHFDPELISCTLGKDGAPRRAPVAATASRQARCGLALAGQASIGMPLAIADERDHEGPFPIRANHPKGWDAKPLAYVQRTLDMAAGLPGQHSTSIGLCTTALFSQKQLEVLYGIRCSASEIGEALVWTSRLHASCRDGRPILPATSVYLQCSGRLLPLWCIQPYSTEYISGF
jgi:hypothetical protein